VRPDIAAVVIATPDHEHERNALAAAAAGKAILLQKPMAMSAEGCRRIIDAAAANGVNLQVSWMHRHFEEVVRARALLADPRLGEVYAVRIRNAVSPAGDRPWCFTPGLVAGGAVMQLGVHGIDLAQHLFGPIRTVSATTGIRRRVRPMPDGTLLEAQLEDHAFAHYGFASGVMGTHEVSFSEARGTDRFLVEIWCADATLQLRGPRGRLAVWAPRLTGREDWVVEDLPDAPPGRRHHTWWAEVLAGRGRDDATAADALAGQLVAEAIYRSAGQGRREAITPAP
jgi:predicted dehydrogenase